MNMYVYDLTGREGSGKGRLYFRCILCGGLDWTGEYLFVYVMGSFMRCVYTVC